MRAGRLIQEGMRDARAETPERAARRVEYHRIAAQAVREREARWPVLTGANAAEALAWQEQRIQELLRRPA